VAGRLTFYDSAPAELREFLAALEIPLPSRKADYRGGELARAAEESLAAESVTLADFRLRGMRKLRFRAGKRPALVTPSDLRVGRDHPDELYEGRRKLKLEFALPPGAYATILVKYVGRDLLPGSRAARTGRKRRGGD
jgi:tRNA pseudouridine13 synthase